MDHETTAARRRQKPRIGLVDVLLSALALLALLLVLFGAFGAQLAGRYTVTLTLSEADAQFYSENAVTLKKGARLYFTDSGKEAGVLQSDWTPESKSLTLRCPRYRADDQLWDCFDRVSIYTGNVYFDDALVVDLEKNDG